MEAKRNSYGLYDELIPRAEQVRLVFSQEDMERHFEGGAFVLDRGAAIKAGFINPYDDDTAVVALK